MSDTPLTQQIDHALSDARLGHLTSLNPNLCQQLSRWLTMLQQAPRNLTAVRDTEAAIAKHIIEPLRGRERILSADIALPHGPLIDVGSGNGAPGIPFALCEPNRDAVLLDSRESAVDFLRQVIEELGQHRVQAVHDRAESERQRGSRGRYAVALSRAAAPPAAALELTVPFLQTGGVAALWTAQLPDAELQRLDAVAQLLGAALTPIDGPHDILVAAKLRPTDERYPRPWNQIRRGPPAA